VEQSSRLEGIGVREEESAEERKTKMKITMWTAEGNISTEPTMSESKSERATHTEGIWTRSILASMGATDISGRGPCPLHSSQK
jgi:hypothetical protein